MNILIHNALILPMDASEGQSLWFRGSVGVSGNRIVMVSPQGETSAQNDAYAESVALFRERYADGLRKIDGNGKLLMPGLINTHTHVPMTLMRGYADDMPLMPWLHEKIWPFEAKLKPADLEFGARLGIAEMLLGGTTTFVDMYWTEDALIPAVSDSGIRAVLGASFIDGRMELSEEEFRTLMYKCTAANNDRIGVMVAPHAPYTCSPESIRRTIALSEEFDLPMTIHVSETRTEVEIMRERYGKTSAQYLDDLGFFARRTLAAHAIHLTDEDMAIFRMRGVSVAHNPESNMKLASGIAPVTRLLDEGVNVALGTDGASSNNDLDMWGEMRSGAFLQKVAMGDPTALPAYEALKMATVNGARALGREDDLGRIREGMLADLILVDLAKPHLTPLLDVVANLAYCGKSSDVDTVIVNGEIVVQGGELLTLDVGALQSAAVERVREIAAR